MLGEVTARACRHTVLAGGRSSDHPSREDEGAWGDGAERDASLAEGSCPQQVGIPALSLSSLGVPGETVSPQNAFVGVLINITSKWDLIWRKGVCKGN